MSSLSIRIPESLHDCLKRISEKDHVSINQFITSAIAEKVTALESEDYIKSRAEKGSVERYMQLLSKVKDRSPDENDV